MSRLQAFNTLVTAGTNALIDAGLNLIFDNVSEEQKISLTMTAEEGCTAEFEINGVPCVAVSRPSGCGEERIVVFYNSTDMHTALKYVRCSGSLLHDNSGTTMTKFTLERKTGRYIMDDPGGLHKDRFRCTRVHQTILSNISLVPNGYVLHGPLR